MSDDSDAPDRDSLLDSARSLGRKLLHAAARRLELRLPTDPVPASWQEIVDRSVPLVRALPAGDRERLMHIVQLFVREVPFEGVRGLHVTEEIQVTIAANACLLLLGFPYPRFTKAQRVLVYPDTFIPKRVPSLHGDEIEPVAEPALEGEAWVNGIVVLAWTDVLRDVTEQRPGRNVVLHEFAHLLDAEDGAQNGTPLFDDSSQASAWERTLEAELARAQRDPDYPLDPYAATDRAEFFAVATEEFFCAPVRVRSQLPDLYAQLARYYRRDPAAG